MSSLNRGQRVIDTTAAIVEFGEITASELAEYLGITRYDAHAVLNRMNKRTKAGLKRIHVVRYIDDHDGARTYPGPSLRWVTSLTPRNPRLTSLLSSAGTTHG